MGVVWLLTLCSFALGCSQQFIMGIPGLIADSCGVGLTEVGQLMTVFSLTAAIGGPIILACTSRVAQRNQLLMGLSMFIVGMLVMGCTSNYPLFLVARVVMGLGSGLYFATAMVLATQFAKPGHQASALANMALGSSAAQIIAMPLAQRASVYMDWHMFYIILAVYIFIACVLITKFVPVTGGAAASAVKGAPAAEGVGTTEGAPADVQAKTSRYVDTSAHGMQAFLERMAPLRDKRVLMALVVMVLINMGYSVFYTYVTPFLEGTFVDDGASVSLVLLVSAFMSIVGAKGSGWLTDHHGYRKTCILALVLQIVTLGMLGVLHASTVGVWIFMCLWVMADWSFNPSQNLLITKLAGPAASMALALSGSSLQLGFALGAAIGGGVILIAPIWVLPYVASGSVAIALVLEVTLLNKVRRLDAATASGQPGSEEGPGSDAEPAAREALEA